MLPLLVPSPKSQVPICCQVPSPQSLCRFWSLVSGPWSLVPGPWSQVPSPQSLCRFWSLVPGPYSLFPILCTFQRASGRAIRALRTFPARSRMRAQTLSHSESQNRKSRAVRQKKILKKTHSPGRSVHICARMRFRIRTSRPPEEVVHGLSPATAAAILPATEVADKRPR